MNVLDENRELVLFENSKIRRQKYNDQWYYSIVDIVGILINQEDYETTRRYWNKLKQRLLKEENCELETNCLQLKLVSKKDGKRYKTDCANRETIFRLIQSIPSPNAEPFKLWFATLAEVTTTELHKTNDSQGMDELMIDAHDGGDIASMTRKNIEQKIKKPVVTSENAIDFQNNREHIEIK